MRYFALSFTLALKQTFRRKGTWIYGILAVILTAGALLLPGSGGSAIRVGIAAPPGQGERFLALLEGRSSELISFRQASEEELDRKILSGQWDCGLVLAEDFEERIASLDTRNILTLKTGPGSTVYPLVRETAAACMMELLSPHIAREYLDRAGMDSGGLQGSMEAMEQIAPRVRVRLEILDRGEMAPLDLTRTQGNRMLRGMTALLTLAWGLYLAVDLRQWRKSAAARRMAPLKSPTALSLPRLAAAMAPVALWGILVSGILGGEIPAYGAFCLCILTIALVLSRIPGVETAIPVLTPGILCASLVLEPVLVEGVHLLPAARPFTRWLPVSLLLRENALALLLLAGGMLLLSLLADVFAKKK